MKTPLQIIADAYDTAGVSYVVRKDEDYFYLVLCDEFEKLKYQNMQFNEFLSRGFMEFDPDGKIAYYE